MGWVRCASTRTSPGAPRSTAGGWRGRGRSTTPRASGPWSARWERGPGARTWGCREASRSWRGPSWRARRIARTTSRPGSTGSGSAWCAPTERSGSRWTSTEPEREARRPRRTPLAQQRADLTQRDGELRQIVDPFDGHAAHETLQPLEGFAPFVEERAHGFVDRAARRAFEHALHHLTAQVEQGVLHGLLRPPLPPGAGGELFEALLEPVDLEPLAQ